MNENNPAEELSISDEELMSRHVIDDDHELHFLDSYLSDIFRKDDI